MRKFPLLLSCLLFATLSKGQKLDTLAYSVNIDDIIVTGQATPLSARAAIHEVRVLTQKDLRARGFTRLSEVLQREVNVGVSQDPILGAGLQLQGLGGQNIQVLIDGMPVVGRLGGNVDLSQIDLSEIVQVEIVAGAMSAQYGSNAAGGVINLITRKETAKPLTFSAEAQAESAGIRYGSAGATLALGKLANGSSRWQVGVGGNFYETNFGNIANLRLRRPDTLQDGTVSVQRIIPWNPKTQKGWRSNLSFRINDELKLEYRTRSFNEELSLYGDLRRPAFRPYVIDQLFTTNRTDHQLLLGGYISDKLYLKATAGYNQFIRRKSSVRTDIEPDTTSNVAGGADTTTYRAALLRGTAQYKINPKLSLAIGLELLEEDAEGKRILDTTSSRTNPNIANYATWLGFTFKPSKDWEVAFNTRLGINSVYNHPVIPAINFKYNPTVRWTIRAGYARGFRAPSVQELHFNFIDINHYIIGSSSLKAERSGNFNVSSTYDLIPRGKVSPKEFSVSLRGFHNEIKDRITLFEFEPGKFTYKNLEEFGSHGLTATLDFKLNERIEARASVGMLQLSSGLDRRYGQSKYVRSYDGSTLLRYEIPKLETSLTVDHRFFGKQVQFVLDENEQPGRSITSPYHLVNLTVGKSLYKNQIQINLGVKDLFDNETVRVRGAQAATGAHSSGSTSRLIGFGRNWFASARLNF